MHLTRSQRIGITFAIPSIAVIAALAADRVSGPSGAGWRSESPAALAIAWTGLFIVLAVALVPRGHRVLRALWAAWGVAVAVLGAGLFAWQIERLEVDFGTGIAAGLAGFVIAIAGCLLAVPTLIVAARPGPADRP